MSDALMPFRWLGGFDGPMGEIFTVSFLHRLDPAEVLRCFVAPIGELMDFEDSPTGPPNTSLTPARMTGVAFTPSILTKPLLVGGIGN
ncbi:hypothetical protein E0500_043070 [Streptomyces sp. KM273126]|uniref:hypothetical protein n=1 Tax=Streptomyces sp. KM273126 TaxID=2545247 RepID=UPI00103F715D|nr:hypothetical protein [Streptomyces sp. KM273126]MBA2813905.1 hypothetical protein [Streptomyces sp. KM273126]